MIIFLEHEWEALIFFLVFSFFFLGGCYKWRLEAFLLYKEIGGWDLSGLRLLKSEDYTYVSLGVWESKGAFKATAELPQDGKGVSRSEIYFFDTTSGCFFKST